jgi:hypothetical protein
MPSDTPSTGASIVARILRCLPGESQLRLLSRMKLSHPGVAKTVATALLDLHTTATAAGKTAPLEALPIPSTRNDRKDAVPGGAALQKVARRLSPQQVQELYGAERTPVLQSGDREERSRRRG